MTRGLSPFFAHTMIMLAGSLTNLLEALGLDILCVSCALPCREGDGQSDFALDVCPSTSIALRMFHIYLFVDLYTYKIFLCHGQNTFQTQTACP
jgi:hypothetical protein